MTNGIVGGFCKLKSFWIIGHAIKLDFGMVFIFIGSSFYSNRWEYLT